MLKHLNRNQNISYLIISRIMSKNCTISGLDTITIILKEKYKNNILKKYYHTKLFVLLHVYLSL